MYIGVIIDKKTKKKEENFSKRVKRKAWHNPKLSV
jgi:hypothetical protein